MGLPFSIGAGQSSDTSPGQPVGTGCGPWSTQLQSWLWTASPRTRAPSLAWARLFSGPLSPVPSATFTQLSSGPGALLRPFLPSSMTRYCRLSARHRAHLSPGPTDFPLYCRHPGEPRHGPHGPPHGWPWSPSNVSASPWSFPPGAHPAVGDVGDGRVPFACQETLGAPGPSSVTSAPGLWEGRLSLRVGIRGGGGAWDPPGNSGKEASTEQRPGHAWQDAGSCALSAPTCPVCVYIEEGPHQGQPHPDQSGPHCRGNAE